MGACVSRCVNSCLSVLPINKKLDNSESSTSNVNHLDSNSPTLPQENPSRYSRLHSWTGFDNQHKARPAQNIVAPTSKLGRNRASLPAETHRSRSQTQLLPLETTITLPQQSREFRVHLHASATVIADSELPSVEEDPGSRRYSHPPSLSTSPVLQRKQNNESSLLALPASKSERKKSLRRVLPRASASTDEYTVKFRPDLFALSETISPTDPTLNFCIFYDFAQGILHVELQKANNLPPRKERQTRDSFVIMFLLPDREEMFESKVVKKSLNPVYGESFELHGIITPEEVREKILMFRIYDNDVVWKDELVGMVYFPLRLADFEGICVKRKIDVRTELQKVMSRGDVLLSLRYNDRENALSGVLHKATNLHNPHIFAQLNPYVKIDLVHKDERVIRWRSQTMRKTKFPIFNETFTFQLNDLNIDKVKLRVAVMSLKKVHWNERIGDAFVGPNSPLKDGEIHWTKMLSSVGQMVAHWHPLCPPEKKKAKPLQRSSSM